MGMAELIQMATGLSIRVVTGLAVFAAFWLLGRGARRVGARAVAAADPDRRQVLHLIARTAEVAILLVGGVCALGTMGINVGALVASLGLTGFALGFALKDALSNLLAGGLILFYRPFRLTDRITVAGFEGRVTAIDLRYTALDADGRTVLLPNAMLFTNPITVVRSP